MQTRRRWWRAIATFALAALVGCGGGGGTDGELASEPDEDVARLQPGDRPVRFRLDTAVSDGMQRFIVETLEWAHADLGDSGPLTVHVYSDEEHFVTAYSRDLRIERADARRQLADGQTAFATRSHIWIYLTNFEKRPEVSRRVALFHEYVHSLQSWQSEIRFQSKMTQERSFVPRWIVEGCAEYLAIQAAGRRGLVDERRRRDGIVGRAKSSAEPLEVFETGGQASFLGGQGEAYTLGWLGCERLAQVKGEDAVAHGFWLSFQRLREWRAAFTDTFGMTPAAFYADFAAFRATL